MKRRGALLCFLIVFLSYIGYYFYDKNSETARKEDIFKINVNSNELLYESTVGYNTVEIYQKDKQIIINAISETDFFDGAQFTIKTKGKLSSSDISVTWSTIGGNVENADDNEKVIADIEIRENNIVIYEKKINFISKGIKIFIDVLNDKKSR